MFDAADRGLVITPIVGELTTQQVRGAQLAVACAARDAADCRLLLDMLGLLPQEVR